MKKNEIKMLEMELINWFYYVSEKDHSREFEDLCLNVLDDLLNDCENRAELYDKAFKIWEHRGKDCSIPSLAYSENCLKFFCENALACIEVGMNTQVWKEIQDLDPYMVVDELAWSGYEEACSVICDAFLYPLA